MYLYNMDHWTVTHPRIDHASHGLNSWSWGSLYCITRKVSSQARQHMVFHVPKKSMTCLCALIVDEKSKFRSKGLFTIENKLAYIINAVSLLFETLLWYINVVYKMFFVPDVVTLILEIGKRVCYAEPNNLRLKLKILVCVDKHYFLIMGDLSIYTCGSHFYF